MVFAGGKRAMLFVVGLLLSTAVLPFWQPGVAQAQTADSEITLTTSDGVLLHGNYLPGATNGPGVVLLHMLGRTQADWQFLSGSLQRHGFHVLSIDLRGHGKSVKKGEEALDYRQFQSAEFQGMDKDVAAAVSFLRIQDGVDKTRVSLVGASIGANLALRYGSTDASITHVVLLSPGLDYKGVSTENVIQPYGDRPVFMVVSREDSYSAKSVLVLDAISTSASKEMRIFTGAGHGTKMLSREPGLETDILAFLKGGPAEELPASNVPALGDR